MKILQISPVFYPTRYIGGVPLVVHELSRRLAQKGHQVTVYTTDLDDGHSRLKAEVREFDGMKVHYFRNLSSSLAFNQKIFVTPGIYQTMKREIAEFDIIHCHEYRTMQNIIVHHFAKKHSVPYTLHPHAGAQLIDKREPKRLFDMLTGYRILRDASRILAITKREAEQVASMGVPESKIRVIANALDMSIYSSLPPRGTFKKKYGLTEEDRVILYLGRVHSGKGIDLLIEAFASLSQNLDNVHLAIAGPDDGFLGQAKRLAAQLQVADRTLFTGAVLGGDKLAAYADADVFFSHSAHGSSLLTYLEAWACRVPVVATDTVDMILPREQVDNVAGYVVPYEKEPLRDAMLKLLTQEDVRQEFGESGWRIATQWYNWDTWTDLVETEYHQVLEEKQGIVKDEGPRTTAREEPIKVSVISTVKNESATVGRLLDSMASQSRPMDELVIVDGGSADGTVDIIRSHIEKGLPIKLLVADGANISQGRNIAIANASYAYIASIDGGCMADRDWLKNITRPFEEDTTVDVVSGSYRLEAESTFEECLREITRLKLQDENRATYLPSSRSIAFKKDCWAQVGGYPEWLYMGEDTLFHVKLKEAAFNFALARDATVQWRPMSSPSHLFRQYYLYTKGDTMAGTTLRVGSVRYMLLYLSFIMRASFSLCRTGKWSALYYGPLVGATQLVALLCGRVSGIIYHLRGRTAPVNERKVE